MKGYFQVKPKVSLHHGAGFKPAPTRLRGIDHDGSGQCLMGLDGDFGDALADFEAGVADEDAAHGLGDGAVDG